MKNSVVLFSGGIDSTTAIFWALKRYEKVNTLTFDYGQRNKIEIRLAQRLVQSLNIPQQILRINLKQIGGSSLTDTDLPLPEFDRIDELEDGPPSTYVPFRNGIFLALAAAWAEVEGIKDIICGFHTLDSPNYPDTRKPFVEVMRKAIDLGTKASSKEDKIRILSPFIHMKKSEIIMMGLSLGTDYSYSISCYSEKEIPCFKCSSCLLRQQAWEEIRIEDPLISRLKKERKI